MQERMGASSLFGKCTDAAAGALPHGCAGDTVFCYRPEAVSAD